jgi:5-methylcytosine-specific restriction enzyme subunit McrC
MGGVNDTPQSVAAMRTLVMHRNMARYSFLLFIARLVAEHSVVTEDGRTSTFIDLERDETKLARLFDAFVRNFYVSEMPQFKLGRRNLTWMYEEEGDGGFMPSMEMDIPLESDNRDIDIVARSRYNPAETLCFKTLDLTRPWPEIHRQLVEMVG